MSPRGVPAYLLGAMHKRMYPYILESKRQRQDESEIEQSLMKRHGCYRCARYCESWERSNNDPPFLRGLLAALSQPCAAYGNVPVICIAFQASARCWTCGTDLPLGTNPAPDEDAWECARCAGDDSSPASASSMGPPLP